jgi:uncharacterized membrane protein
MAVLYILAGINHFRQPDLYQKVIPPFIPFKKHINEIVGFLSTMFGIYIFIPVFTEYALWSIIALLIAVFPSNIYMLVSKEANLGIPKWILVLRLPLQLVLIYWAYQYLPNTINNL